ncbi:MAG: hypothetical protein ABI612_11255 [Betaproteobacteria bacterium]
MDSLTFDTFRDAGRALHVPFQTTYHQYTYRSVANLTTVIGGYTPIILMKRDDIAVAMSLR